MGMVEIRKLCGIGGNSGGKDREMRGEIEWVREIVEPWVEGSGEKEVRSE